MSPRIVVAGVGAVDVAVAAVVAAAVVAAVVVASLFLTIEQYC